MEYINLKKEPYLSVEQMNAIYNNLQFLKNKFENLNLKIGSLIDTSVTYNISPSDILSKFNEVEVNIKTIHKTLKNLLGKNEKYYKDFVWTPTTHNRKNEVWRWIDWMNNANSIEVFYENLYDIDNNVILDKYGEPITILSGKER